MQADWRIWVAEVLVVRMRIARLAGRSNAVRLVNFEQLYFKDQRGIGRDCSGISSCTVGELGRYREPHLVADTHSGDAAVPSCNHLSGAQHERERLVAIDGAVELGPVRQPASVMDGDGFSSLR